MFDLIGKTNINFIGKRNVAFVLSGALVVLGLSAVIAIATGKANLGIDFAGGTAVQLNFDRPVRIGEAGISLRRMISGIPNCRSFQQGTNC